MRALVGLANISAILGRHGFSMAFFRSHRPARSAFGTTGLALGARMELECIAAVGS